MIAESGGIDDGRISLDYSEMGFVLMLDGYRGLDTKIYFDWAKETPGAVNLYIRGDIHVGRIEMDETFRTSSVGSALRAIEHNQLQALIKDD